MPDTPEPQSDSFLMKKWGPLPIAAYVVAAAALIGFMVFRNRSTGGATTTSPGPIAAPTGIQDPSTDQNSQLISTLNDIETQLAKLQSVPASPPPDVPPAKTGFPDFISWLQGAFTGTRPDLYNALKVGNWGALSGEYQKEHDSWQQTQATNGGTNGSPVLPVQQPSVWPTRTRPPVPFSPAGAGGAEAPMRILPDYVLRPPVYLDTEGTRRPPVLTSPQ